MFVSLANAEESNSVLNKLNESWKRICITKYEYNLMIIKNEMKQREKGASFAVFFMDFVLSKNWTHHDKKEKKIKQKVIFNMRVFTRNS